MLWLPEHTPPQVTEEAKEQVSQQLLEHGLSVVAEEALHALQTDCDPLAAYLDELGFTLNQVSAEGLWASRLLNIGAAITFFAYREADYFPPINKLTIELGQMTAKAEGIPEAYVTSLHSDYALMDLLQTISESYVFREDTLLTTDQGGFRQVLDLGAGCTRFYMQQALEVA